MFTAAPQHAARIAAAALTSQVNVTRIGAISAATGLRLIDRDGRAVVNTFGSFDHFKS